MSHDIYMKDDNGNILPTQHPAIGGSYRVGGPAECYLNITYNYTWFYIRFLDKKDGITWVCGKKGKDCIKSLRKALRDMGFKEGQKIRPSRDYWEVTPNNAAIPLQVFIQWCKEHPNGHFEGG